MRCLGLGCVGLGARPRGLDWGPWDKTDIQGYTGGVEMWVSNSSVSCVILRPGFPCSSEIGSGVVTMAAGPVTVTQ